MACDERIHLLETCASTMLVYTQASINWQRLTDGLNSFQYREARMAREAARIQVDLARYELEKHEEQHQCFPAETPRRKKP